MDWIFFWMKDFGLNLLEDNGYTELGLFLFLVVTQSIVLFSVVTCTKANWRNYYTWMWILHTTLLSLSLWCNYFQRPATGMFTWINYHMNRSTKHVQKKISKSKKIAWSVSCFTIYDTIYILTTMISSTFQNINYEEWTPFPKHPP